MLTRLCVLLALVATRVAAQAPAHIALLTVPPSDVGTCMPAHAPAARDTSAQSLRGHRLVMTARSAGRREMTVYADAAGHVRRYVESASRITDRTGTTTSVDENVIASVSVDGRVRGMVLRTTVALPTPTTLSIDSASLRTMQKQARTSRARAALSAREQAQVLAAAAWLRARCPG